MRTFRVQVIRRDTVFIDAEDAKEASELAQRALTKRKWIVAATEIPQEVPPMELSEMLHRYGLKAIDD